MANAPNNLKPTGLTTKMMPGGSRKVCVLDGGRQINQVIKGKWTTLKMLLESGLPKGIYRLGGTTKTSSGKDASFAGQVLLSDNRTVYQLSGKGVVKHPRSTFAELEARDEKIIDGCNYTVAYANGKGVASNARAANVAQPRATSKGHGASI